MKLTVSQLCVDGGDSDDEESLSAHFREKLIDQDIVMLSSTFQTSTHLIGLQMDFYLHHFFFIQIEGLQFVRDQLCFSGLSSEVQPLPSDRAGPERQRAAGFRSEAAVCWTGESRLQTEDSEVSSLTLCYCCKSHMSFEQVKLICVFHNISKVVNELLFMFSCLLK